MNKKGQVYGVVLLFIGVIVALALIPSIFNTQAQMTTKQTVDNQSVSVVNAFVGDNEVNESVNFTAYTQSAWKQDDCPLTSVTIRNGAGTELTADTDYTLYASQGVYSLLNTSDTVPDTSLNLTYVDYTYCADGYNKDSGSRNVAALIGLFSALALVGFVLSKLGLIDLGFMNR